MRNRTLILIACLFLAAGMVLTRTSRREYVPVKEDPERFLFWGYLWAKITMSILSQYDTGSGGAYPPGEGGADSEYATPDNLVDSTSVLTPPERPVPPPVPKPEPKPPKTR